MCLNDYKGVAGGSKVTMPRVCKSGEWGFFSQQRQAHFLFQTTRGLSATWYLTATIDFFLGVKTLTTDLHPMPK
jgi:hypothetical protein